MELFLLSVVAVLLVVVSWLYNELDFHKKELRRSHQLEIKSGERIVSLLGLISVLRAERNKENV